MELKFGLVEQWIDQRRHLTPSTIYARKRAYRTAFGTS